MKRLLLDLDSKSSRRDGSLCSKSIGLTRCLLSWLEMDVSHLKQGFSAINIEDVDTLEASLKEMVNIAIDLGDEARLPSYIPFVVDAISLLLEKAFEFDEIRPAVTRCIADFLQVHDGITEELASRLSHDEVDVNLSRIVQWDSTSTISPSYSSALLRLRGSILSMRCLSGSRNPSNDIQKWICLLHKAGDEKNASFRLPIYHVWMS
jgi:hypothetical protein